MRNYILFHTIVWIMVTIYLVELLGGMTGHGFSLKDLPDYAMSYIWLIPFTLGFYGACYFIVSHFPFKLKIEKKNLIK